MHAQQLCRRDGGPPSRVASGASCSEHAELTQDTVARIRGRGAALPRGWAFSAAHLKIRQRCGGCKVVAEISAMPLRLGRFEIPVEHNKSVYFHVWIRAFPYTV
ncbi:uncharacterized protein PSANT_06171 [Moesziomyces antarcticus]|uniref:Uncharacterized protein n=1 Tax=Pseudozyma antarctica TaxID=84753 RepID=A0A5C3FW88_PSEA2|nr:uncharacterized protein PSANT_06171 [Moesziomyces antarcticus]